MTPREKMSKARTQLLLSQPFFGTLALRLRLEETDQLPTVGVDGVTLFYNPKWVAALPLPQLVAVVAHEVMHCACQHHTRMGNRDHVDWNAAGDYAINGVLDAAGFDLPAERLLDPAYDGKSADEIYATIHCDKKPGDQKGDGKPGSSSQGQDPGGCGAVMPAPAPDGSGGQPSPAELAQAEQDWKIATLQAASAAKVAGKLPGGLDRLVAELREPVIDWRELLRRFLDASAKNDYSWTPPNRRFVGMGLYLPSLHSNELGEIVVAVDTSMSIDQGALEQFAGELAAIMDELKPVRVHVVYCDTKITRVDQFEAGEGFELSAAGGGGTKFSPPFAWVEEQGIDPACLIYFTDLGASDFPNTDQPYPVLWAAYGTSADAPMGETIHLDR